MPELDTYPKCFGPYLLYAISTGFENFEFSDEKRSGFRLFFLAEFNEAGQESEFAKEMKEARFSIVIDPADDHIPYATLHTDKEAVVNAVSGTDAFKIWEKYVSRVELSLPLVPSELVELRESLVERWHDEPGTDGVSPRRHPR